MYGRKRIPRLLGWSRCRSEATRSDVPLVKTGMPTVRHATLLVAVACLGVVATLGGATEPSDPLSDWIQVPPPEPGGPSWYCDNYSPSHWEVSETPSLSFRAVEDPATGRRQDPLPFELTADPSDHDLDGDRLVRRLANGWLVGFDNGEWGGGLWWFSPNGSSRTKLKPSAPGSDDAIRFQNTVGFDDWDGKTIVLMGLGGLGGVFRVDQGAGRPRLLLWADLKGRPHAWIRDGESLLVQTGDTLWRLLPSGQTVKLHKRSFPSSPRSLALGPSGTIYIGLRRFVVRLAPVGGGLNEGWFVRKDCNQFTLGLSDCKCRP